MRQFCRNRVTFLRNKKAPAGDGLALPCYNDGIQEATMLETVVALLLVVLLIALALYEHERQPPESRRDEDRPPEWW